MSGISQSPYALWGDLSPQNTYQHCGIFNFPVPIYSVTSFFSPNINKLGLRLRDSIPILPFFTLQVSSSTLPYLTAIRSLQKIPQSRKPQHLPIMPSVTRAKATHERQQQGRQPKKSRPSHSSGSKPNRIVNSL